MNNSEELRAQVKALLREDELIVKLYPGTSGHLEFDDRCAKVIYCPDPKGGKIIVPLSLKGTPYIKYSNSPEFRKYRPLPSNAVRFLIGGKWMVRVMWNRELDAMCIHLPTGSGAAPYILWYDWDEDFQLRKSSLESD